MFFRSPLASLELRKTVTYVLATDPPDRPVSDCEEFRPLGLTGSVRPLHAPTRG